MFSTIKQFNWHLFDSTIVLDSMNVARENIPAWEQEEIANIVDIILRAYQQITVKEIHKGADRQSFDVMWQHRQFSFHFEYYSQSIWFEAIDVLANEDIDKLYGYLNGSDNG